MENINKNDFGVTIFTPTYNRAHTLSRLYESLCRQTNKNFEWIIVNDGSTDNTKDLVRKYINDGIIGIRYYYQSNQGKPIAHNIGVQMAKLKYFVCVDSDDYLTDDAIEKILKYAERLTDEIGMVLFRGFPSGKNITQWNECVKTSTLHDAYKKYGLQGDTMLVYKTEIIKKEYFPQFEKEKFVPESYLYDRLDRYGKMKIINDTLYICEYLKDGYTATMRKVIKNNPKGYEAYIVQRIDFDDCIKERFFDSIRYICIKFIQGEKKISNSRHKLYSLLALLPGYILYIKEYKKI